MLTKLTTITTLSLGLASLASCSKQETKSNVKVIVDDNVDFSLVIANNGDYEITLTPKTGYVIDKLNYVIVADVQLTNQEYSYDESSHKVTIKAQYIKSNDSWISIKTKVYKDQPHIKSLTINSDTLHIGEQFKMPVKVTPENAVDKRLTWSSSNKSVADFNEDGYLVGKEPGTTTITVKSVETGVNATCTITVDTPVTTDGITYQYDSDKNLYLVKFNDNIPEKVYLPSTYDDGTNGRHGLMINNRIQWEISKTPATKFIDFPKNLALIEGSPFSGYEGTAFSNLEQVIFHEGLKQISDHSFYGLTNLKTINLPDSLERINDNAFEQTGITAINYSKNNKELNYIGESAFNSCTGLSSFPFEYCTKLRIINQYAFLGDTNLKITNLPESIVDIGVAALFDCVDTVIDPETHITYAKINGNDHYLAMKCNDDATGDITFNPNTKIIGGGLFNYRRGYSGDVNNVTFSSSIKSISSEAFKLETGADLKIKDLIVPSNIEYIGRSAFQNTTSYLETITFNEGLIEIGDKAFANSTKLTKLQFPNSLKYLGTRIINDIANNSPESIEGANGAFLGCTNLQEVKFNTDSQLEQISSFAFNNTKLTNLSIPKHVTHLWIGSLYFGKDESGEGMLGEVTVPDSVIKMRAPYSSGDKLSYTKINFPKNSLYKIDYVSQPGIKYTTKEESFDPNLAENSEKVKKYMLENQYLWIRIQ